jgi:hypothetical protein
MRRKLKTQARGRQVVYGYVVAAALLLTALALRAPSVEAWFWRSLGACLPLVVSFRSALIYTYRRHPSALSWWLRPAPHERSFATMWLVYAVVLGAASLFLLFI